MSFSNNKLATPSHTAAMNGDMDIHEESRTAAIGAADSAAMDGDMEEERLAPVEGERHNGVEDCMDMDSAAASLIDDVLAALPELGRDDYQINILPAWENYA